MRSEKPRNWPRSIFDSSMALGYGQSIVLGTPAILTGRREGRPKCLDQLPLSDMYNSGQAGPRLSLSEERVGNFPDHRKFELLVLERFDHKQNPERDAHKLDYSNNGGD